MKKLKRLVFGGIENKTHALVLISMLLVATVYSVSMVAQDNVLSHLSQETNKRQLATMTGTTTEALDSVIVQNMDRITEMEAKLTDELFRDRMIGVQMVGDYATKLLENPGDVARVAWHRPDASHDGELFVKALFAPGLEPETVDDQLGVLANMTDLMLSLCASYGTGCPKALR